MRTSSRRPDREPVRGSRVADRRIRRAARRCARADGMPAGRGQCLAERRRKALKTASRQGSAGDTEEASAGGDQERERVCGADRRGARLFAGTDHECVVRGGGSTGGVCSPAARSAIDAVKQVGLPAFFGVTIARVLIVAAIDTVRHRREHPAFARGAALVIAAVPGRIALAQSDVWVSIAGWLVALTGQSEADPRDMRDR